MVRYQQTIKECLQFSGIGLFSGVQVSLCLKPAPVNSGIKFVRTDLNGKPSILATASSINGDARRVFLKNDDVEVESIEHLMSSLAGLCIDNIEVEINKKEMPSGDGSSLLFVQLLKKTEIVKQDAKKKVFKKNNKVVLSEGNSSISFQPGGEGLKISYILDYGGDYINDEYNFTFSTDKYCDEIAAARTFGIFTDVAKFKEFGIGKGITDDNTFVIQTNGEFLKPLSMTTAKLRFSNECVRHKILDLIGDISLSNMALSGHIIAKRSGHSLNLKMAKKLVELSMSVDN